MDDIGDSMAQLAMANSQMSRAEDYVKRGRQHGSLSIADLQELFVVTFRDWSSDFKDQVRRRANDDVEAEFTLRGVQPPFDRVGPEMEKLQEAIKEVTQDPDAMERVAQSMLDEWIAAHERQN
ncbi:MAG: hypothetical protein Devi2KO_04260 [Devosia indica]